MAAPDLGEPAEPPAVAGVIERTALRLDHEPSPEALVEVGETASRPVLRGNEGESERAFLRSFPPRHLAHAPESAPPKPVAEPGGSENREVARKERDRGGIEMVVVIVRDDKRRQRRETGGIESRGAVPAHEEADPRRKDRIDENCCASKRRQERRVTDPGDARRREIGDGCAVGGDARGRLPRRRDATLSGELVEDAPAEDLHPRADGLRRVEIGVAVGHVVPGLSPRGRAGGASCRALPR